MDKFSVVCTKSFYAGQGISFEEGDLKTHTITKEEADAVCKSMISLAYGDSECWTVLTFDDWYSKYLDPQQGPKAAEKLKKYFERRDSCPKPHDYKPRDEKYSSKWVCSVCEDELDGSCATWYMNGRRDERKLS